MSEQPRDNLPEETLVQAMEQADRTYVDSIIHKYPPKDKSEFSRGSLSPGEYWGQAMAVACAELGLPIGFTHDGANDLLVNGSKPSINYWLNVTGFEHHSRGNIPDSESRSGIFKILNSPDHSELFEHIYAEHQNLPIEEVMMMDPMIEIRKSQPASAYEIIDHKGIARLYKEDPENCLRLYLTRQLPQLKHLRKAIKFMERSIAVEEEELELNPGAKVDGGIIQSPQQREERIQFDRERVKYWQINYGFTLDLLSEGYKPYTLEEVVLIAKDYLTILLAEHPELNIKDPRAKIPDIKKGIGSLLTSLEKSDTAHLN